MKETYFVVFGQLRVVSGDVFPVFGASGVVGENDTARAANVLNYP